MNLNDVAILKMDCSELEKIKRYCKFWRDFYYELINDEADYIDNESSKDKAQTYNSVLHFIEMLENPPKIEERHNETINELLEKMKNLFETNKGENNDR